MTDNPIAAIDSGPAPSLSATAKIRAALQPFSFNRLSGLYVWAAIFVLFALWVPNTFLTETTWKNIAASQAVTAMITLGLLVPLAAGIFDLSVGYTVGLSAMLSAYLVHHGFDTGSAIVVVLFVGVVIGIFNGILVVAIGINSFIATLGVGSVLLAMTGWVSGNESIVGLPASFDQIGIAQPLGIPIPVFYLVVVAIVLWYVLEHSPAGRYLYSIGGGEEAARLAGVPVKRLGFLALIASALIASVAGVVVTGKLGAGDPSVGPSYLLPAFAAAYLGATQVKPGRFNVVGALIATYLLATGVTGLQLAGASFWVTDLFNGLVLILALTLARLQGQLRLGRFSRKSTPKRPVKISGKVGTD
ncbi:MAG TPA: ABC transporter permease [Galbitalea sp.]|jgi:ribose transport system permease protein|nr:ABC transporter permease [Galbitalea sp.]